MPDSERRFEDGDPEDTLAGTEHLELKKEVPESPIRKIDWEYWLGFRVFCPKSEENI